MGKRWAVSLGRTQPPQTTGITAPKNKNMILSVSVNLKEIAEQGRNFLWPRPEVCPNCGQSPVWSHGFVDAFFDGYDQSILLRRYRCPACGCVITLRPKNYFSRFHADKKTIRSHITTRLKTGRWPPGVSKGRCRNWIRALKRQTIAFLSLLWLDRLPQAFDRLMMMGKVPVSGSI